jgi:riboflavin kinase/FMN adenylyltransferase
MPLANEYLGYDYFYLELFSLVEPLGPHRKHKIEEDYKLIPHNGVYVVKSIINQNHFGMMNIGFNPTVSGEKLSIEVHFFDFDTDLYDQKIKVSILKYIRTEQKFDSVDLLNN